MSPLKQPKEAGPDMLGMDVPSWQVFWEQLYFRAAGPKDRINIRILTVKYGRL